MARIIQVEWGVPLLHDFDKTFASTSKEVEKAHHILKATSHPDRNSEQQIVAVQVLENTFETVTRYIDNNETTSSDGSGART